MTDKNEISAVIDGGYFTWTVGADAAVLRLWDVSISLDAEYWGAVLAALEDETAESEPVQIFGFRAVSVYVWKGQLRQSSDVSSVRFKLPDDVVESLRGILFAWSLEEDPRGFRGPDYAPEIDGHEARLRTRTGHAPC